MRTLFYDFESYYDREYSLKKMTQAEYILDHRFEATGCAFQWGLTGQAFWVEGPQLQEFFDSLKPIAHEIMSVAHNAQFDASIANWRYGFLPALLVDTLGVARALLGHLMKYLSLKAVAKYLGLGDKGEELINALGLRLEDIKRSGRYLEYIAYALQDVKLCAGIYEKLVLSGQFPASELLVMDNVLRCVVDPMFRINKGILVQHLHKVKEEKEQSLAMAMLAGADGKDALMSNPKFAELLREVGVEPPMKVSALTGKITYAFAKSDPEFMALQEHDDPRVQTIMAARLGHKTTIEETRTEKFIQIADLQWPQGQHQLMPIPLRYAAAHTHRLGGDWGLNVQNLGRDSMLRMALESPDEYIVYAPDSSQIEARGVGAFCGQTNLVNQFENKEDVYATFASEAFGFKVDKKTYPDERFIGKQGVLGLGFSAGAPKFRLMVRNLSTNQLGKTIDLGETGAQRIVDIYRNTYAEVPRMWKNLNNAIWIMFQGKSTLRIGPVLLQHESILLPNGLKLKYQNLRQTTEGWLYDYGPIANKRLYGGALLENIIQALARIIVMDAAVRIRQRTGKAFQMQVHDELVYIIKAVDFPAFKVIVEEELRRRPTWLPSWPLDMEGAIGKSYGEAK